MCPFRFLFLLAVNFYQGLGFRPSMKSTAAIKISATQGSCLIPVAFISSTHWRANFNEKTVAIANVRDHLTPWFSGRLANRLGTSFDRFLKCNFNIGRDKPNLEGEWLTGLIWLLIFKPVGASSVMVNKTNLCFARFHFSVLIAFMQKALGKSESLVVKIHSFRYVFYVKESVPKFHLCLRLLLILFYLSLYICVQAKSVHLI